MSNSILLKNLKESGLKENHARVLMNLIQIKQASVNDISKKTNIPRSSVEIILKNLCKIGLANSFKKKNILYFNPEDPKAIIDTLKHKNDILIESLPLMQELYRGGNSNSEVRFYNEPKSLKTVLDEALSEAQEIIYFGSPDALFDTATPKVILNFIKKRIQKKIPIRVIFQDSPFARKRAELKNQLLMQSKIIDINPICNSTFMVWKNKVALLSSDINHSLVVIENKELADLEKAMFEGLWKTTENYLSVS